MRDRDRDAPLRRPVELRECDPGHADGIVEQLRLPEPVLARGRVEDEERLVRRPVEPALDHAAHLGQLLHEVGLRVEPPSRVDHDHVAAPRLGGGDGVERDGRRVGAALRAHEVGARALGPDLKLLLGSGAEGVGGREDDGAPRLAQPVRELADRRRLARAVDAHDEHDGGRPPERQALLAVDADQVGHDLLQALEQRLAARGLARLQALDDLDRGRDAAVRRDERLLDALPRVVVARVEEQLARERLPAGGERVTQPAEPAPPLLVVAGRGAPGVAQELRPAESHKPTGGTALTKLEALVVTR